MAAEAVLAGTMARILNRSISSHAGPPRTFLASTPYATSMVAWRSWYWPRLRPPLSSRLVEGGLGRTSAISKRGASSGGWAASARAVTKVRQIAGNTFYASGFGANY